MREARVLHGHDMQYASAASLASASACQLLSIDRDRISNSSATRSSKKKIEEAGMELPRAATGGGRPGKYNEQARKQCNSVVERELSTMLVSASILPSFFLVTVIRWVDDDGVASAEARRDGEEAA
jgi:hypothetical protein